MGDQSGVEIAQLLGGNTPIAIDEATAYGVDGKVVVPSQQLVRPVAGQHELQARAPDRRRQSHLGDVQRDDLRLLEVIDWPAAHACSPGQERRDDARVESAAGVDRRLEFPHAVVATASPSSWRSASIPPPPSAALSADQYCQRLSSSVPSV
jgi:hypothetical protein